MSVHVRASIPGVNREGHCLGQNSEFGSDFGVISLLLTLLSAVSRYSETLLDAALPAVSWISAEKMLESIFVASF